MLIPDIVYKSTIDLIEGKKPPSPLLKDLREFYSAYGITLYNLFLREKKNSRGELVYLITVLSNVPENYVNTHPELKNFDIESLDKYFELCKKHRIDTSRIGNYDFPRKMLGTGFYFDRIWADEIINQAGKIFVDVISNQYKEEDLYIVNAYGCYTVFMEDSLTREKQIQIEKEARAIVDRLDTHKICDNKELVRFEYKSVIRDKYGGKYYLYFM